VRNLYLFCASAMCFFRAAFSQTVGSWLMLQQLTGLILILQGYSGPT
jgi:hypothetical protein